jgi:radical SAM protein with 4Fe4S-binding SPASM domain
MIRRRHSPDYNFTGDTVTGLTMRWGGNLEQNPYCAPWPELADISISNHCSKGCDYCYRDSKPDRSFLPLEQYCFILDSLSSTRWGNVFQVALGGGEPLEHPDFAAIIDATVERGIIVNFTTNGEQLDRTVVKGLQNKVGAVALSASKVAEINPAKIKLLTEAGIKTNIHFILDNHSLPDALALLQGGYNDLLQGVNGLIFLTYKPKGRARADACLSWNEPLQKFVAFAQNNQCAIRIGFDACFVPLLLKYTEVNVDYIDACECGFFSVYIDEKLKVKPCSFGADDRYSYNLHEADFQTIWEQKLAGYREMIVNKRCGNECSNKRHCRGGCPYFEGLTLCYRQPWRL